MLSGALHSGRDNHGTPTLHTTKGRFLRSEKEGGPLPNMTFLKQGTSLSHFPRFTFTSPPDSSDFHSSTFTSVNVSSSFNGPERA